MGIVGKVIVGQDLGKKGVDEGKWKGERALRLVTDLSPIGQIFFLAQYGNQGSLKTSRNGRILSIKTKLGEDENAHR